MQRLTLEYLFGPVVIVLDEPTSDCRCPMKVEPAWLQETFEGFCNGEDDGRGIPMGPGSYTAMGIQGVFYRMAKIEVEGVGDPEPDVDVVGLDEEPEEEPVDDEEAGESMLDGVLPKRVGDHYALLERINK